MGCVAALKSAKAHFHTDRAARFYDCCAAERGQAPSPQGQCYSESHVLFSRFFNEEPRVTAKPLSALLAPLQTARQLAAEFALTAVERDERGGTPKAERDALRHSGLLALSIPVQYGGLGASWSETLNIVRLFARPEQWQQWFEQAARKNWFWGNALNPLDTRTVVKNLGGWREFCWCNAPPSCSTTPGPKGRL